jgi:hypothetical protein
VSGKRWTLVLDVSGAQRVFTVRGVDDGKAVIVAVEAALRDMSASGGCKSMVIAVHVEGPACDHELPRGG